jgi:DNA-binding LytR/AlgR family response regulator
MELVPGKMNKRPRLVAFKEDESYTLKMEDIACLYSKKPYIVILDKNGQQYFYDKNLSEIEKELEETTFFRANRQYILNINYIRGYKVCDRVKLEVKLAEPIVCSPIIVSQKTAPVFKKWVIGEF